MEFIINVFIVLFIALPIIGALSVLPLDKEDNNGES